MRNKYAGVCACGERVEPGAGYFERRPGGRWIVRCMACVIAGKAASGKTLSRAQEQFERREARDDH